MKRISGSNPYLTKVNFLIVTLSIIIMNGCGAVSTSGRYESDRTGTDKDETEEIKREEMFDLKPYRPELNLEEDKFDSGVYSENSDIWYEYKSKSESSKNRKIIGTIDGYRVQVIATDDLDEANRINTEVSSQIPNLRTYVNFEPPFYKVKVGDFNELSEANDMRFRLSQTGYTESKVVRETINIFE